MKCWKVEELGVNYFPLENMDCENCSHKDECEIIITISKINREFFDFIPPSDTSSFD